MRRSFLLPACLLLVAACPAARAQYPWEQCCSTYPVYLCPPGYLGYPIPPYELATYGGNNGGCSGCSHGGCDTEYGCGQVTPNPYSCCFYGVTLSNYALVTPLSAVLPGHLPTLAPPRPAEKLTKPPTPK
jgi:hypothetical protein